MPPKASVLLKNVRRAPEIFRCARQTAQWSEITRAYLGFSRLKFPTSLRLRNDDCLHLQELTDLKTFWQIFLRRVYRVEASDRVILDIGANVGIFSLYAARRAPRARIFSFEPFPSTFERLQENVREHDLTNRIVCQNFAVNGDGGARVMRTAPLPSQQRTIVGLDQGIAGIQVQAKTLTDLLWENDLQEVDLLKMDIEGGEYEVFLSTAHDVLRRIQRIAVEYHGHCAPYSKRHIFEHLRESGFEIPWDVEDDLGYGVAEAVRKNSASR